MDDEIPYWLPDLILLEVYHGNWSAYIDAVYQQYYNDFVKNRPLFENLPVFVRNQPAHQNKGATFWHLVSEGTKETDRIPDIRRCERIRWPRPLIEGGYIQEVKIWEQSRPWKGQVQRRIMFSLKNFNYIVVIGETPKGYTLITAYHIEKTHQRQKLKKEFEAFSRQKKEGSAL